ncbi:tetratricopeptide repeat protein [Streptomyces xanthophaeus]
MLPELEAFIAELQHSDDSWYYRPLLLEVRALRMAVLVDTGRLQEAEAEGRDILTACTRIANPIAVWEEEVSTLIQLAAALSRQGRHEEAEQIARGNLPRTEGPLRAALNITLVGILNGQGRYEEALVQAREPMPEAAGARTGSLELAVATALYGLGQLEEAKATAREALQACEQVFHPEHSTIRDVRALLTRMTCENALD